MIREYIRLAIPFFMLSLILVASYRSPSLSLLVMGSGPEMTPLVSPSVEKKCIEQLLVYLLANAPQILDTCGWLFIRFYILWKIITLMADVFLKPFVVFIAKKAYRAFCRWWFPNNPE